MCAVQVRDLLIDRMPEWSGSGLQKRRRPHPSLPARGQGYRIWLRPPGCASWRNIVACHSGRASRVLPGEREPESSNQSGSYIHAGRGLPGRQPICDSPPQKSRGGRVGWALVSRLQWLERKGTDLLNRLMPSQGVLANPRTVLIHLDNLIEPCCFVRPNTALCYRVG
jgi:hypothetical protein